MPRPKGSKNKKQPNDPNFKRLGRPPDTTKISKVIPMMSAQEILDAKVDILHLLSEGEVELGTETKRIRTVSDAARALGIKPRRVYDWCRQDRDFQDMLKAVYEVIADDIEAGFLAGKNDIPKMMLLKGIRPQYRDNFKIIHSTEALEKDISELKRLGQGEIVDQTQ